MPTNKINLTTQTTGTGASLPVLIPLLVGESLAGEVWTNMPGALTEFQGTTAGRVYYNLTNTTSCRLQCTVMAAGAAGASLRVQYSTNNGVTWNTLISGLTISTLGTLITPLVAVVAGAKTLVLLRCYGIGGNGVTDPRFGRILLEVI